MHVRTDYVVLIHALQFTAKARTTGSKRHVLFLYTGGVIMKTHMRSLRLHASATGNERILCNTFDKIIVGKFE